MAVLYSELYTCNLKILFYLLSFAGCHRLIKTVKCGASSLGWGSVNNQKIMKKQEILQLSKEFSKVLLEATDAATIQEINRRNEENELDICSSHDFVDTNVIMEEAFQNVFGRQAAFISGEDERSHQDQQAWILAWFNARINDFYLPLVDDRLEAANELLKLSLRAFNQIPNKRFDGNKNTYQIASAIDAYFRPTE
jgi:hypothetical protein